MKILKLSAFVMQRLWKKHSLLLSFFAISGFMLAAPMTAKAFKVDTHVWVAQQVLNDLEDGKLTIPIGGVNYEYPVDDSIVSALRLYPNMYRMGNAGTDGLPDMVAAQLVIHPGIDGAWQTDDWLKWVYNGAASAQQKAFAYGYLAHAAADVFSHTYVNEYSGDIFLLTDGEIENEKRHIALEKFIAQLTPPLTNSSGIEIGKPYDVVATPASFIRDRLILNNTVADQYQKGSAVHLYAVQALREELANAYGPLATLDTWIVQLLVQYFADIRVNEEQAQKILELAQKINDLINAGSGIDQLQAAKDNFVNYLTRGAGISIELQQRLDASIVSIAQISARLDAKALELAQNQDVYNAQFLACFIPQSEMCKALAGCNGLPTSGARDWCRGICDNATRDLCNQALSDIIGLITNLVQAKQSIERELLQAHQAMSESVQLATNTAIATIQAQNDILNGLIDTGQRMTSDLNIFRAQIDGWRQDIVNGMDAYVLANGEVLKESMKEDGHMLKPLQDWFDCWGMAITMGLPAPLNQGICSAENRIEKINEAINEFEARIANFVPVIAEWNELKDRIMARVNTLATETANRLVEKVTGIDVQEIIALFENPVDAATLNAMFSEDRSMKGLPLIGDIAQRVLAEMHLASNGYFDPELYSVAYNSVLFAKLSLLSAAQLDQLAWDAGVGPLTRYGNSLYGGDGINSANIILGFIRSIDGNHQWMQQAPPYPRQQGYHDDKWPLKREYGYGFGTNADGYTGLRIWEDPIARERIFLRVFHGPLVPGIEYPPMIEETWLRWLYFPYPVCLENPFPLSVYDDSCRIAGIPATLPPKAITALTTPPGNSVQARSQARGQTVRLIKRQHGNGVGKRVTRRGQ